MLMHDLSALTFSPNVYFQIWFPTLSGPSFTTTQDGIPTTIARNYFPPPAQPADNATTGLWKAFEDRRRLFDIYDAATLLLLNRIKITLPSADKALLSNPILGLVNFTPLDIISMIATWNVSSDGFS